MTQQALMRCRYAELRRRVKAVPEELTDWVQRSTNVLDMNAHSSQLQAINVMIAKLMERQDSLLKDLEQQEDPEAFSDTAFQLMQEITKTQRVWDFFRDKLGLRFSPIFKGPLWIADTVAWDCYRPIIEEAADEGILARTVLREPPLTYLAAELSPVTFARNSHLFARNSHHFFDGRDKLHEMVAAGRIPIPVIELPWDHVNNLWELLSIHHEVGHDLMADLQIETILLSNLKTVLTSEGVAPERVAEWEAWAKEVFADLVALQLAGPAFVECIFNQLFLPALSVTAHNPKGPHPTAYIRVMLNVAYIRTIVPGRQEIITYADQIKNRWESLYGVISEFTDYLNDFPHVFKALMDTPLQQLKGKTVRELIKFNAADDARIRAASKYLLTGQNMPPAGSLKPRHCISAARLAVTEGSLQANNLDAIFKQINDRTGELVRDNAVGGLRAGDSSEPHRKFIASFVDNL